MSNESDENSAARRQSDLIIVSLEGEVRMLSKTLNEIKMWLMGDGTVDNPGIMVRLDRLETIERNRLDADKNHATQRLSIYGALVVLFIERLYHYISTHIIQGK